MDVKANSPISGSQTSSESRLFGFSANVFFLGIVSFLTDISSEMTLTILPVFLANVLKVQLPIIGLIEGAAESTATILKIFSGWFSDVLGARKVLTSLGYGISSLSKPLLYFAASWPLVLFVRVADRVGKGIRTSPRDALIAESTAPREMGRNFGFHRTMDSAGAVLGLAAAALIVYATQSNKIDLARESYQRLVLIGAVPAILAVFVIVFLVKEVKRATPAMAEGNGKPRPPSLTLRGLDHRFKLFLVIIVLFTLGNSSDAFLLLRAQNLGLSVVQILIMLAVFNLVTAAGSLPSGIISDHLGRRAVIIGGWTVYALIYLGFAIAGAVWQVWLLYVLYGLYYAATDGVGRAFVADMVPSVNRGTAYGVYNAAIGVSALPASLIAGLLWQTIGPAAPFFFGAALAGLAVLALIMLVGERKEAL